MDYSFNTKIALKYGVEEAVFVHNMYWWLIKNEANGRHYYDGRTWTYNSKEAFTKLFPFWTEKQLRRIVNNLKDKGALYTANYNTNSFDRTLWYALSDEIYNIYGDIVETKEEQKGNTRPAEMGKSELPEQSNTFDQTGRPIPDNKPYNKPNINIYNTPLISPHRGKKQNLIVMLEGCSYGDKLKETILDWLEYKKFDYKETGFRILLKIIKEKTDDYGEDAVIKVINESMSNTWKGIAWDKLDRLKKINKGGDYGRKLGITID